MGQNNVLSVGMTSSAFLGLLITWIVCAVSDGFVTARMTRNNNIRVLEVKSSILQMVESSSSSSSFMDQVSNFFNSLDGSTKNQSQENDNDDDDTIVARDDRKKRLLDLIESTPQNAPTSKELTQQILEQVKDLEDYCPTPNDDVLEELAGNWQLLWTAQDKSSLIKKGNPIENSNNGLFSTWINPLENQAYSNNPIKSNNNNNDSNNNDDGDYEGSTGRSNPILPRNIQDRLETMGILEAATANNNKSNDEDVNSVIKSSQAIDFKKNRVRNVVSVQIPRPLSKKKQKLNGSLTVDVKFQPDDIDNRKINVKFNSCRVTLQNSPLDFTIPLGPIGPTGWLRTGYVDETIRITRGHKGSVFILSRTAKRRKTSNTI